MRVRDFRVVVQPERLRRRIQRQRADVADVLIDRHRVDRGVDSALRELIPQFERVFADVNLEDLRYEPHVLVVGDPAAVVNLRAKVVQHLVGYLLVVVQQHLQLPSADGQILVRELVRDVPANRAELPPVLNRGVEQAEPEQKPPVLLRLLAVVELLVVHVHVRPEQVVPQPGRRFERHFHPVLQDRNREVAGGHACEPEPEVPVHAVVNFLANPLEVRHPRLG